METKRIYRSTTDRVIGGVAAGLAAYIGIDPLLVRLVFVILALANGLGALLYLALWLLLPALGSTATSPREVIQDNIRELQAAAEQLVARLRSAFK